jgi:hypothetical protein
VAQPWAPYTTMHTPRCSRTPQVNGGHLPDHVLPFCIGAAAIAACLPLLNLVVRRLGGLPDHGDPPARPDDEPARPAGRAGLAAAAAALLRAAFGRLWREWRGRSAAEWVLALMPSGVGVAIGAYLQPQWTLPRLMGSIADQLWLFLSPGTHKAFMIVTASGLVLGEGCASIITAAITAALPKK